MTWTVMSVDPGGKTGFVIATWPSKEQMRQEVRDSSAHEAVVKRRRTGNFKFGNVTGPYRLQAVRLWELSLRLRVSHMRIEDFQLMQGGPSKQKTQDLLSPVKVGWGLAALLQHSNAEMQVDWPMPGEMGVITDERLKLWGLWLPGDKDARAALKHLLVYLRKL